MDDQASGLRQLISQHSDDLWTSESSVFKKQANKIVRSISVTSGKGGVGKTNVVGNLAVAFSKLGKHVLILDGDLGLANIDILFGVRPVYNIKHVIHGEKKLSEVIINGPENIKIIPGGSGLQGLSNLTHGQRLQLMNEFEQYDEQIDILLIDTGAGISTNITYLNIAAEERIVISTPEPTSITDAYALMKVMYRHHGEKQFKLLVNMATHRKEAEAVYANLNTNLMRFLKNIQLEYIGFIPKDEYISKSVKKQSPVLISYPKSISGRSFLTLAQFILEGSTRESEGTFRSFWTKLMSSL